MVSCFMSQSGRFMGPLGCLFSAQPSPLALKIRPHVSINVTSTILNTHTSFTFFNLPLFGFFFSFLLFIHCHSQLTLFKFTFGRTVVYLISTNLSKFSFNLLSPSLFIFPSFSQIVLCLQNHIC